MANLSDLTVTVSANLTVSDETAERCLRLLEMWQKDNPNRSILTDKGADGTMRLRLYPESEERAWQAM